jgi:hypothetical protein
VNKLDELTEELNKVLADAQTKFATMSLSVAASIEMEPGLTLSFQKAHGAWCIAVCDVPIQHCSRERKMKAVYKLEVLRLALLEEHLKQTEEIKAALEVAKNFVTETSTTT